MTSITDLPIPVYHAVKDFKQNTETALSVGHSWAGLAEEFTRRYGRPPTHIVRAPGRVNIIGEHIDYALFGVLPAAIENDLLIAISPSQTPDGVVTVENTDPKFTKASFSAAKNSDGEWQLDINPQALRWEGYVKAGYLGVLERFFSKGSNEEPKGMDALFTSTIPPGCGVSSSAALIVATTLAFLVVNDKISSVSKGDLVGMSVGNEKRVGVNSGGMDQSASILSSPESALYISFYPKLQVVPTSLPTSSETPAVFVIANSLAESHKAETGKFRYNLRVVETLVGARILSQVLGLNVGNEEKLTYRQVLEKWYQSQGKKDGEDSLKEEITAILQGGYLEKLRGKDLDGVTLDEMVRMTNMTSEDFHRVFLSWVEVEATQFQIYKRAMHVFTEALRVLQFRDLCMSSRDSSTSTDEVLVKLGKLMDESQDSCANLFECSCPELDKLTAISKTLGAYGSRLTGAGWGGCTVSLVKEADVLRFISRLKEEYEPYQNLDAASFTSACFATKPAEGACVYQVD